MGKGLETLPTGDKRELGSPALLSDPHQAALHASSNALGKNEDIQELDFSSERHGPSMEPAVFKVRSCGPLWVPETLSRTYRVKLLFS